MNLSNLVEDMILDEIFIGLAKRQTFNARQTAENQYADDSRAAWLKRNIAAKPEGAAGD